jgi:hypothetical protein
MTDSALAPDDPTVQEDPSAPEFFADGVVAVPGRTVVSLVFYRDPPLAGPGARRQVLTVVVPRSHLERRPLADVIQWPKAGDRPH